MWVNHTLASQLYEQSASRHGHLCPRQVLGVRMGLLAAEYFHLSLPQQDKRLFTIVETDGCFADGVAVSTGCELGRRTLRLWDYGKVAATFIDTHTMQAVRVVPHAKSREYAQAFCPEITSTWNRYVEAYQKLPDEMIFTLSQIELAFSLDDLISEHGLRVRCDRCGEEIINKREILHEDQHLCRACASGAYYVLHS